MNDTFGDFNATQIGAGASGSGAAASEQRAEGIAPVLIKQILDSPEGNYQMWGMTFGMVACAAIVRSIDTSSTKITYLLEDHTGRIEAHYWLDEGDILKTQDIMLNNYAKIYASVRSQQEHKTLMVFKILPITDPNEICTHVLEVLNARYKSEEYTKKGAGGNVAEASSSTALGGFGIQQNANNLGLEGKSLAVYQAIKNYLSEEGISRQQLQAKFSHISQDELNQILTDMSGEGHIYSSINNDHFLCTE